MRYVVIIQDDIVDGQAVVDVDIAKFRRDRSDVETPAKRVFMRTLQAVKAILADEEQAYKSRRCSN